MQLSTEEEILNEFKHNIKNIRFKTDSEYSKIGMPLHTGTILTGKPLSKFKYEVSSSIQLKHQQHYECIVVDLIDYTFRKFFTFDFEIIDRSRMFGYSYNFNVNISEKFNSIDSLLVKPQILLNQSI